ncbi:MAG: hypothetical protein ACI35W_00610 [Anaeroplasmataceae bacterium]
MVDSEYNYELYNYCEKMTFYFNVETLLLERMTSVFTLDTKYLSGSTSIETTYEYGCSDYIPAMTAYNAHVNAEEKSNFIVVRNAGCADENRMEYVINNKSKLKVRNSEENDCALFEDADCTVEVKDYKDYTLDGYVPVFYLAQKNVPTVSDLLEANDTIKVVDKYGDVHASGTCSVASSGDEYKSEWHVSMNEYGLVFDAEEKNLAGELLYSVTVMDGVRYLCLAQNDFYGTEEELSFAIIGADDYDEFVKDQLLSYIFDESVEGKPTLSAGKIGLSTSISGISYSYVFNAETLLLESCTIKNSNFLCEVEYTYGVSYTSSRTAYNMHQTAEDKKEIAVIRDTKTDFEMSTECTISASSIIYVLNIDENEYELFENVSCTNPIENISEFIIDNEYPTLYLGAKNSEVISFVYTYSQNDFDEFLELLAEFEETAKNENESLFSVQISFDYMYDKYLYICAQLNIARGIYDLDNTDSKWEDYILVYNACSQSYTALNATYKDLYNANVKYSDLIFKNWTQEDIANLLDTNEDTSKIITELNLENEEIINYVDKMNMYDESFLTECSKEYVKLVANNQEIAKLSGYENYYEYSQKEIYFRDWSLEEIADFTEYVKEYLVPLFSQITRRCSEIKEKLTEEQLEQANIIISNIRYSQLETDYVSLYFNSYGGTLTEHFNSLFDKKTGIFADGENGTGTAYANYIEYYGEPYCIFGSGDYYQAVNTVIHEAGHYASFYNYSFYNASYDLCETHSQSNEFLFLAFMKNYLDEQVYEFCVASCVNSALSRIIQTAIINEFETMVYSAQTAYTVDEYAGILSDLCAAYGKNDDATYYVSRYALCVSTISSCYYISYGLSLVPVLDLFTKAKDDYKGAQECYRILMEDAAKTDGFKAALAFSGIGSPFDESTFLNIKEAFDFDAVEYSEAVQDALLAKESEIRELVTLTADDERVSFNEDGKVLLLTFHKYPSSYVEGETSVTGSWYMWTVTDGEIIDWYAENQYSSTIFADKLKQVLGMPISSSNTYISAVWVDISDVIRPAYQTDPTKQLTASDLDGSALGEYENWFNSNIISSYCSTWGQYPWTRLGYTYNWGADDAYGLSEFVILPGSEIKVEFTKTIAEFSNWLAEQIETE